MGVLEASPICVMRRTTFSLTANYLMQVRNVRDVRIKY